MSTKKIMIVSNSLFGLYKFRKELISELSKNNELVIVAPKEYTYFRSKHITWDINRKGKNLIQETKSLFQLYRIIKRNKPDIILSYTIKPNLYVGFLSRFMKIPNIATVTGFGVIGESKSVFARVLKKIYLNSLKRSKHVFFQNKTDYYNFDSRDKLKSKSVIPGSGVNLGDNTFSHMSISDHLKFIFVGRIVKEKGIFDLLEAFSELNDESKPYELCVIGPLELTNEEEKKRFRQLINVENIDYLGFKENVVPYMTAANALILPSYREGMSNVVLEACAQGRPCLVSDVPGCKDIIVDEYNGFTFKPRDVKSIKSSVNKFASLKDDMILKMGKNARDYVENHFDRVTIIELYVQKIEE